VVADEYPNFSICGIQFLVPGDVRDWRMLAHRSRADLEAAGVRLLLNTTANDVEVDARRLSVADGDGRESGCPMTSSPSLQVPLRKAIRLAASTRWARTTAYSSCTR
jgi:NADPH-dependent 2,4-dienoyl-CoA reductase/sulfur reductase-like enzyme